MQKVKRKQIDFGGTENQYIKGDGTLGDSIDLTDIVYVDFTFDEEAADDSGTATLNAKEVYELYTEGKTIVCRCTRNKLQLFLLLADVRVTSRSNHYLYNATFTTGIYSSTSNKGYRVELRCNIINDEVSGVSAQYYEYELQDKLVSETNIRSINNRSLVGSGNVQLTFNGPNDNFYFPNAVQDIDGNWYGAIIIGDQVWLAENLRTRHLPDGTEIEVLSERQITSDTIPYAYYPSLNPDYEETFGLLYNYAAISNGETLTEESTFGIKGISPNGWHIPTNEEFHKLYQNLEKIDEYHFERNTDRFLAKALASTIYWRESDSDGDIGCNQQYNNKTGFNAMPAGHIRSNTATVLDVGNGFNMSSCTVTTHDQMSCRITFYLYYSYNYILWPSYITIESATSVRCVCDLNAYQFVDWYVSTYGSMQHNLPQEIPPQQQTDWNQNDNTQVDFIKNKPTSVSDFDMYIITIKEQEEGGVVSCDCDRTAKEITDNVIIGNKKPVFVLETLFAGSNTKTSIILNESYKVLNITGSPTNSWDYSVELQYISDQYSFGVYRLQSIHYTDNINDSVTVTKDKADIAPQVFVCSYNGTTVNKTFNEIKQAYNSGKVVICKNGNNVLYLEYIDNNSIVFTNTEGYTINKLVGDITNNTWEYSSSSSKNIIYYNVTAIESGTNKVTLNENTLTVRDKCADNNVIVCLRQDDLIYIAQHKGNFAKFVNITGTTLNTIRFNTGDGQWYYVYNQIATSSSVNNGVLTIQKNGTTIDTFSANEANNKTINITVPTSASDVNALPDSTKYGASLQLSFDDDYTAVTDTTGKNPANEGWFERSGTSPNYVYTLTEDTTPVSGKTYYKGGTFIITATLKDQDGNTLGTQQQVDLPLESVVVDGYYDSNTKNVILVLKNGGEISFSVADLVSGLQSTLVSGTNIKTINGTSILGSGNISTAELPAVTSSDNGKILIVDNGAWAATTVPVADNVLF